MIEKTHNSYFFLDQLAEVGDIKKLDQTNLPSLAQEIRDFLIETTEKTGGHLSSNLGVVELTLALHYLLDLNKDEIIWDVSHQSYIHKILSGRKKQMHTIRQFGGLSGFAKIKESPYDPFGGGHACVSISAALGIALAKRQNQDQGLVVCVVGDGAMTGGMIYEALNNISLNSQSNLLIILNDNEMSISKNVGGIVDALNKLINSAPYRKLKKTSKKMLQKTPDLLALAKKGEEKVKDIFLSHNLFEALAVSYHGVIDGHNLDQLIENLQDLIQSQGVRMLHIQTQKGKGIAEAELDPLKYHGVKPKDKHIKQSTIKKISYSEIFGKWLEVLAAKDPKMIAVTPAMSTGSGMDNFAQKYPKQFFDVGIAEQHSMTFCAGYASKGQKAILAIYSTFLQRAYDQLIHDVSVQQLDLSLAIDRAGIVGEDGPTHSGQFDLSFLRILPKIVIMSPSDELEMIQMLQTAYNYKGLAAVRYPKGNSKNNISLDQIETQMQKLTTIEIGKAKLVRHSKNSAIKLVLLVFGDLLFEAKKVAEKLDLSLVDMRFVKPIDQKLLLKLAKTHQYFVTIEENAISAGAGSGVSEFFNQNAITKAIKHIGIEDDYVPQGNRNELLINLGLDAIGIEKQIKIWLKKINKMK